MGEVRLPNWPARMKAPLAAAYLGIGQTKFLEGVKAGKYPQAVVDDGNKLWRLSDLTNWVERNGAEGAPSGDDPYMRGVPDVAQGHAR